MPAINSGWAGNDRVNFGTQYQTIEKYSPIERRLLRDTAGSGYGKRRISALLKALVGNTVGQSKAATETRRKAFAENFAVGQSLNGKVTMETYAIASGVTTTADVTRIQTILNPTFMPTFPVNKDGVGSGGRTNAI